jgi:hypothetical protein
MIATTTSNSISEKPLAFFRIIIIILVRAKALPTGLDFRSHAVLTSRMDANRMPQIG